MTHYRRATDRVLLRLLDHIVEGFVYDPGHSDLDNEQPISINITLGDYRMASALRWDIKENLAVTTKETEDKRSEWQPASCRNCSRCGVDWVPLCTTCWSCSQCCDCQGKPVPTGERR